MAWIRSASKTSDARGINRADTSFLPAEFTPLAALHESAFGPKRTWAIAPHMWSPLHEYLVNYSRHFAHRRVKTPEVVGGRSYERDQTDFYGPRRLSFGQVGSINRPAA